METLIYITDITRMGGRRVCVAGVTKDGVCVRPVLPEGIFEPWLYQNGSVVVRPYAKVKLDLIDHIPKPPHTEDWDFDPDSLQSNGLINEDKRERFLNWILDPCVADIFGTDIHDDHGFYLQEGEGNRSLGTIKVKMIVRFDHNCNYGSWDYRLHFIDAEECHYQLKVTDLGLRYYVDHLRKTEEIDCFEIGRRLTAQLRASQVYLRIGLARKWHPDHDQPQNRCYLQITGVYTFPDYLEGRCFADFV